MLQDTSGGAAFAQFGSSVFLSDEADMLIVGECNFCRAFFICFSMLVVCVNLRLKFTTNNTVHLLYAAAFFTI